MVHINVFLIVKNPHNCLNGMLIAANPPPGRMTGNHPQAYPL